MADIDLCSAGHPPFSLMRREAEPDVYDCRRCGRVINAVPCGVCGVLRVKGLHPVTCNG